MRVCLIGSATAADTLDPSALDDADFLARDLPLGILVLAGILEQTRAISPAVVDPNLWYYEYVRSRGSGIDFHSYAASRLADLDCDVYGFSSLCSSYPLTIRIAQQLKSLRPSALVVFGGPQASVVDQPTLQEFPFVDFILRGEADLSFPEFIERLDHGTPEKTPALTYRSRNSVVRNCDAPTPTELDTLPLPAFHLYPMRHPPRKVPLELGRGCPFACTFCSTNDFFRRRFRLKSPQRMLADMDAIAALYPVEFFDLVHDMFTVDRRLVVSFCEALLAAGSRHRWGCSARTDCIDTELIDVMARAGCVAIFFGIETGSVRMQKIIDKGLDLGASRRYAAETSRRGIRTTVSLIAGYPEETMDDLRGSLDFIGESLSHPNCTPHFHLLAPLAGTPIERRHQTDLWLEDLTTDAGFARWDYDAADHELVRKYRGIFPNFYSIPTPFLDREYLIEMREFFAGAMGRFRWILAAWYAERRDMMSLFDAWRGESRVLVPAGSAIRRYYYGGEFQRDFVLFLVGIASPGLILQTMIRFEEALLVARQERSARLTPEAASRVNADSKLGLANGVYLLQLDVDPMRAAELLDASLPADEMVLCASNLVVRRHDLTSFEVRPISKEAARLLALCDGNTRAEEVLRRFALDCTENGDSDGDIDGEDIAAYGLRSVLAEGLVAATKMAVRSPAIEAQRTKRKAGLHRTQTAHASKLEIFQPPDSPK
jgi:radical SAM superfamily enzyme YgiQ (UPF0313 family)